MGDNIYLGDRNGVRTPMQWSPDRNAGFSAGNPQSLFLPTIIDHEYHYETRQRRNAGAQPAFAPVVDAAADRAARPAESARPRDRSSSSIPTTPRCWRSSASTRTSASWSWPTCRARRSSRSST